MFGELQATQIFELTKTETLDQAAAKLLEFAEYPKILRWIQFPTALVVFLAHETALDCGAIYLYDRKPSVLGKSDPVVLS